MRMISVHGMDEAQKRRVTVNAQDEKRPDQNFRDF